MILKTEFYFLNVLLFYGTIKMMIQYNQQLTKIKQFC